MPILFVGVLNQKGVFVTDVFGTTKTGDFKSHILKHQSQFITFGKRQIPIDSEININYRDEKTYTCVCIANSYDIKELEAQTFLEKVEEMMLSYLEGDIERTQSLSNRMV